MRLFFERGWPKITRQLAWLLAGLVTFAASVQFISFLMQALPVTLNGWSDAVGWGLLIPITFAGLGALIIHRQPGNRVGWLMMLTALTTVEPTDALIGSLAPTRPEALTPGLWLLLTVNNWSWVPTIFAIFLIPLHFPTGRPPSLHWRWVNRLALVLGLFFITLISVATEVGPFDDSWRMPNPIGFVPVEFINETFLIFWGIGLMTIVLGSVSSLFVRFRRAAAVQREQIKWLLYAGAFFAVAYALTFFLTPADANSDAWGNLLLTLAILLLPVAIAIAILRYRLYDIDIIIRRTLQYAALTALLALVYFGTIVLLQGVVERLTGEQSPVVIVLSTLLIAALFTPLRRRVQDVIDRRFYRRKYDAQQVLAAFAVTARDETDLTLLTAEVQRVIQETVQPVGVNVWLRQEQRLREAQ